MQKKMYLLLIIFIFFTRHSYCQSNTISVIGFGDGITVSEATNVALRHCIEKTFGVFISTNSQVSNDELIKDEITTLSSGNIVSYQIIDQVQKGNLYSITVSALVSPDNLVSTFKNKGYSFEVNGNLFTQNILKEKFYKEQEPLIIKEFLSKYLDFPLFDSFNIRIESPIRKLEVPNKSSSYMFEQDEPVIYYAKFHNSEIGYSDLTNAYKDILLSAPINRSESYLWNNLETKNSQAYVREIWNNSKLYAISFPYDKAVYSLPIYYTPNYNPINAERLSLILQKFFNSIQIKDKAGYEKLYGPTYDADFDFMKLIKNKKDKIIMQLGNIQTFQLRNPESIAVIYNYSLLLNIKSNPASLFVTDLSFKPELLSQYYESDAANSIVMTIKKGLYSKNKFSTAEKIMKLLKFGDYHCILRLSDNNDPRLYDGKDKNQFAGQTKKFGTSLILFNLTESELSKLKNINFKWIDSNTLLNIFNKGESGIIEYFNQNIYFPTN